MASVVQCDRSLAAVDMSDIASPASIKELNFAENALRAPGNLEHFPNLVTLILDKNGLPGLLGLPPNPHLRQLWFNNNCAEDLVDFCDQACALFPGLNHLQLMRNPASPPLLCTSEEESAAARRYRLYVLHRLPGLAFLDNVAVTKAERLEAAATGHLMAPRKPRPGSQSTAPPRAAATSFSLLGMLFGGGGGEPTVAAPSEGGGGGSAAPSAAAAAAAQPLKKPSATLAVGRAEYNGRNSEGNRFISDRDL